MKRKRNVNEDLENKKKRKRMMLTTTNTNTKKNIKNEEEKKNENEEELINERKNEAEKYLKEIIKKTKMSNFQLCCYVLSKYYYISEKYSKSIFYLNVYFNSPPQIEKIKYREFPDEIVKIIVGDEENDLREEKKKILIIIQKIINFIYDDFINFTGEFEKMVYYERGLIFYILNDYENGLRDLSKSIELNTDGFKLNIMYIEKANVLMTLGMFEDAVKCYNKIIELQPDNPKNYFLKGNCFKEWNMKFQAIECFTKAIELQPDNNIYYFEKASCYEELNMKNEAILCYNMCIKLKPDIARYHFNKGHCYISIGGTTIEQALECFKKALELEPNCVNYFVAYVVGKGTLCSLQKKNMEAISLYTHSIDYIIRCKNNGVWNETYPNFDIEILIERLREIRDMGYRKWKKETLGVFDLISY